MTLRCVWTGCANSAGSRRGKARPEATRRLVNKAFLEALAEDFRQGAPEAIAKVRKYQPAAYMKICALLVPREMKLEHSGGIKAMTDEQIDRAIAFIEEQLGKREAGANAKVIDSTHAARARREVPAASSVGGPAIPLRWRLTVWN